MPPAGQKPPLFPLAPAILHSGRRLPSVPVCVLSQWRCLACLHAVRPAILGGGKKNGVLRTSCPVSQQTKNLSELRIETCGGTVYCPAKTPTLSRAWHGIAEPIKVKEKCTLCFSFLHCGDSYIFYTFFFTFSFLYKKNPVFPPQLPNQPTTSFV